MCDKLLAAVGELEQEEKYKDRVQFHRLSVRGKKGVEMAANHGFGGQRHGTMGFDEKGEHVFTIPGHSYGKEEIVAKLEELLR